MRAPQRRVLQQRWVHSREEDTPDALVFRPASFRFPPARGRESFELKADGTVVERATGPADRGQETRGHWQLEDDQRLAFRAAPGGAPHRVLQIVSAESDRLVVKR